MAEKDQEFVPERSVPKSPLQTEPVAEGNAHPASAPNGAERDAEDSGRELAEELEAGGFQPVILFGNAASGKTSLLLSLFAAVQTEHDLQTGLHPSERLLPADSEYGEYLHASAEEFLGRKLQAFISGSQPPATNIELPFFVPINFAPRSKPEQKFAFLESNGEWYRPDFQSNRLYPKLRKQIEDFIAQYQGGIIFIHLLPFTQEKTLTQDYDGATDSKKLYEAELAIVGALQAYKNLRFDKQNDYHMLLVTKWDARTRQNSDVADTLTVEESDLVDVLSSKYRQAFSSYSGLGLPSDHTQFEAYCAGVMTENGVLSLKRDNELRPFVLQYPMNLWTWLYRRALEIRDQTPIDPFPAREQRSALARFFIALLDRVAT